MEYRRFIVQWTSKYRWDPARRRAEGQLLFPVPLPGLLFVELGGVWRSEQWDIPSQGRFQYKSSGVPLNLKHIPDHRLELGAGLEYLNRAAANTGRVLLNARFQANRWQIQIANPLRQLSGPGFIP